MSNVIPKLESGLTLFCAAIEYPRRGTWIAETRYMEAPDLATAKANFALSMPSGARFVAVAPAIGFHVKDKHGEQLEA